MTIVLVRLALIVWIIAGVLFCKACIDEDRVACDISDILEGDDEDF